MTLPIPIWIVGAVLGGVFGFAQGMWIRQMLIKNSRAAGGAVPGLARFIVPMEAAAFALVGGVVADRWLGGAV